MSQSSQTISNIRTTTKWEQKKVLSITKGYRVFCLLQISGQRMLSTVVYRTQPEMHFREMLKDYTTISKSEQKQNQIVNEIKAEEKYYGYDCCCAMLMWPLPVAITVWHSLLFFHSFYYFFFRPFAFVRSFCLFAFPNVNIYIYISYKSALYLFHYFFQSVSLL